MLRKIVDYFRSCFCEHDWEFLGLIDCYYAEYPNKPYGHKYIYRCKKCGYVQNIMA